jgi:oligopeptide transport system permease protein
MSTRAKGVAATTAPTIEQVRSRSNLQMAAQRFVRQRLGMVGFVITSVLLLVAICAPFLAPYRYDFGNLREANEFPSATHWFGTDAVGQDYFSRIIYGVRTSMLVGFMSVAISCCIGIPLGLLAGLRGGKIDFFVMRVVDVMTAFPGILFAIFLITVIGGGVSNVIFVIGLTGWVTICRLMRAQLLTLREQEWVTAARSIGASETAIAVRHLLPNALAPLIITITLAIPSAIFTEAGLSFLGIGINEPTPSLGKMVAASSDYIRVFWHLGLFPTVAIALSMLGFTFVGDGLRDALDTRAR